MAGDHEKKGENSVCTYYPYFFIMDHETRYINSRIYIRSQQEEIYNLIQCLVCLFCCSGRIPRLSFNQHSLYVGVVKKTPPPPLAGEQYGKMEPKYPEGGHCKSVLRPQGVFNVPLYFK